MEDKINLLIIEVKALQAGQLNFTTPVEAINTWSINAEEVSVELRNEMKSLTSRMMALEATISFAPPREEEGRADDHLNLRTLQGGHVRVLTRDHTLGKGEFQQVKTPPKSISDFPESVITKRLTHHLQHTIENTNCLKR